MAETEHELNGFLCVCHVCVVSVSNESLLLPLFSVFSMGSLSHFLSISSLQNKCVTSSFVCAFRFLNVYEFCLFVFTSVPHFSVFFCSGIF